MKLNEHSKNELRNEILELLKKVPDGQRVEIPLDVLDELIFLKIKDLDDEIIKFPVWTGQFLRKIDLSKLSFDNVHWSPALYDGSAYFSINKLSNFGQDAKDEDCFVVPIVGRSDILEMDVNDVIDLDNLIDFSFTNINPNITPIFSEKANMYSVNLEGVDLSSLKLSCSNLRHCNLKDTKLNISYEYDNFDIYSFYGSNLTNCNFTSKDYDLIKVFYYYDYDGDLSLFPNFVNTGLKFVYNHNDIKSIFDSSFYNHADVKSNFDEFLSKLISSGKIDGCYLNGNLVNSNDYMKEMKEQKKLALREEYENMKKDIFESTLGSIEEQIKKFGGK